MLQISVLFEAKNIWQMHSAHRMPSFTLQCLYTQDIHDLFAALIVQIPLDTHRYLFRNYPNTFTSEDAIQALGSLRFSYTARVPDPNDNSKLIRTTTTTTFNMEKDMAKALCQQFQLCRLTENATDPQSRSFQSKGIWQLTPKGLCVLQDFCVRTEADMTQLRKHFSNIEPIQLVRLERHPDDDQILYGHQNLSVVFRIMMSSLPLEGELEKNSSNGLKATSSASSAADRVNNLSSASTQSSGSSTTGTGTSAPFAMASQISSGDSRVQLLANNLLTYSKKGRKGHTRSSTKTMRTIFSTQLCCDWLTDYSTVSSRDEAEQLASEFVKYGWLNFQEPKHSLPVKASKTIMLSITPKGKDVVAEFDKQSSVPQSSSTSSLSRPRSTASSSKTGSLATSNRAATDDEQTTLREMLSQDPETAKTAAAETTGEDSSTTKVAVTNGKYKSSSSQSRPPSSAVEYNVDQKEDPKESNAAKLKLILDDPQLRSLFKDFLRANFCEENLDFWIDYSTLRRKCRSQSPAMPSQNQKDLLEDAHDIWSTYIETGSPCELNVEHSLRQEIARLVSSIVQVVPSYSPGQVKPTVVISTASTSQSLRMMLKLLDRVNEHICRLMASDSVPKFVKTPKYRKIMEQREHEEAEKKNNNSLLYGTPTHPSVVENPA